MEGATDKKITIYSAPGCAHSRAAKEFLLHHRVAFIERDVSADPGAMAELVQKVGRRATPCIVMGQEVVEGFDRGRLQQLLGLLQDQEETLPPL